MVCLSRYVDICTLTKLISFGKAKRLGSHCTFQHFVQQQYGWKYFEGKLLIR